MTSEIAKSIGVRKAIKAASIGLIMAYFIMVLFSGGNFLWIMNFGYIVNILIGVTILYGFAYLFGKNAGFEILIKKKDSDKVGVKYGLIILITTACFVGWTGYLQEGIGPYDSFWDSFEDYIFKPFFWIIFIGFIPTIVIGIQFGKWVEKSK